MNNGNVVKIMGKVSLREDEKAKILVSKVDIIPKPEEKAKIFIRLPKDKFELEPNVIKFLSMLENESRGNIPVYLFYDGTNKLRMLQNELWLNDDEATIKKLQIAFGSENVKLKK